jgi:hypothetical protein
MPLQTKVGPAPKPAISDTLLLGLIGAAIAMSVMALTLCAIAVVL